MHELVCGSVPCFATSHNHVYNSFAGYNSFEFVEVFPGSTEYDVPESDIRVCIDKWYHKLS